MGGILVKKRCARYLISSTPNATLYFSSQWVKHHVVRFFLSKTVGYLVIMQWARIYICKRWLKHDFLHSDIDESWYLSYATSVKNSSMFTWYTLMTFCKNSYFWSHFCVFLYKKRVIIFDQRDPLKILRWKVQVFIYYSRSIVSFLLSVKYEYIFINVTRTHISRYYNSARSKALNSLFFSWSLFFNSSVSLWLDINNLSENTDHASE